MEINNNILEARIITGEEEEKYWKDEIIPQILKSQARIKNQRPKTQSNRKKNKRQKTSSKPADKEKETIVNNDE